MFSSIIKITLHDVHSHIHLYGPTLHAKDCLHFTLQSTNTCRSSFTCNPVKSNWDRDAFGFTQVTTQMNYKVDETAKYWKGREDVRLEGKTGLEVCLFVCLFCTEKVEEKSRATIKIISFHLGGFQYSFFFFKEWNKASPPYPGVPHRQIQPNADSKYLQKEFQKVPKSKTWICCMQATMFIIFILYLHSIYLVLGTISNLEMI